MTLLLLMACGFNPELPDAGTPCGCSHQGATWSTGDVAELTCAPVCTPQSETKQINGSPWCDAGESLCFGDGCCVWAEVL